MFGYTGPNRSSGNGGKKSKNLPQLTGHGERSDADIGPGPRDGDAATGHLPVHHAFLNSVFAAVVVMGHIFLPDKSQYLTLPALNPPDHILQCLVGVLPCQKPLYPCFPDTSLAAESEILKTCPLCGDLT